MAYCNLRDGDAVVTDHGFIFYVFGYDHPESAYNAFLKYVPEIHAEKFDLDWLDVRWRFRDSTLVRPRELYSPVSHAKLIEAFRRHFPDYISFSGELNRWMIRVPRRSISEAYIPSKQLLLLRKREARDALEENTIDLLDILSKHSGIPQGFFGIHGSISLGMHHEGSDIDIAVYGGNNYSLVKGALAELEGKGLLTVSRRDAFEKRRMNRGFFRKMNFVINATRRFSEIHKVERFVRPLGTVEVECLCKGGEEAVFRPAVYEVSGCSGIHASVGDYDSISQVVSMNGLYRDVVRAGERMRVKGILEEVTDREGERRFRVVVGSGIQGEYISWNGF